MNIIFKRYRYIFLYIMILSVFLLFIGCNKGQVENAEITSSTKEELPHKELLPQMERSSEELEQDDKGNLLDPFSGSLRLTGILMSKYSTGNMAIVEANNTSYIVKCGDIIADYWNVDTIESTSVLLKNGSRKLTLNLKTNK